MESELLWSFYDDMFACRIPTDHMVIFGTFQEAFVWGEVVRAGGGCRECTYAYNFVKNVACGLASDLGGW
jgi:hypothetical protein